MRSWLQALALALVVAGASAAHAGAPEMSPPSSAEALERMAVDDTAEPAAQPIVVERSTGKPSGFWTSTRPARGGAYRYRLLGIGVAIASITGAFMIWLVRRKGQPAA